MVTRSQIDQRENPRTVQTIQQGIDPRDGVAVEFRLTIEEAVIYTHAQFPGLLPHEQNRMSVRRR